MLTLEFQKTHLTQNKPISIAIDGPSAAGKSTLARAIAEKYGFLYVDTGAIYRTVGLAVQNAEIEPQDTAAVVALLPSVKIDMVYADVQRMFLNGADVTQEIRTPKSSLYASDVSKIPEVRAFLMDMQRDLARRRDVVMDGRDIGTVVLPDADVKIFLTASAEVRARRRCLELKEKGMEADFDTVLHDIVYRDRQDMERAAAPLKAAEDAVLLDNSEMDFLETVAAACQTIYLKTGR